MFFESIPALEIAMWILFMMVVVSVIMISYYQITLCWYTYKDRLSNAYRRFYISKMGCDRGYFISLLCALNIIYVVRYSVPHKGGGLLDITKLYRGKLISFTSLAKFLSRCRREAVDIYKRNVDPTLNLPQTCTVFIAGHHEGVVVWISTNAGNKSAE